MVIFENLPEGLRLQLLPNRSASWKQVKRVVIALSVLALGIAIFWSFQGAWIILPFAGLEVALLAYFAHRVSSASYHQQIVYIKPESVEIEWGYYYPKKRWSFEHANAEFIINRPAHSLSPAIVEIEDDKQCIRLGELLNKDDIDELIDHIRHSGAPYRFTGITRIHAIEGFDLS